MLYTYEIDIVQTITKKVTIIGKNDEEVESKLDKLIHDPKLLNEVKFESNCIGFENVKKDSLELSDILNELNMDIEDLKDAKRICIDYGDIIYFTNDNNEYEILYNSYPYYVEEGPYISNINAEYLLSLILEEAHRLGFKFKKIKEGVYERIY